MTKAIFILSLVFLAGCEFFAPDVSKALSETEQVKINSRQVQALERIAAALETKH